MQWQIQQFYQRNNDIQGNNLWSFWNSVIQVYFCNNANQDHSCNSPMKDAKDIHGLSRNTFFGYPKAQRTPSKYRSDISGVHEWSLGCRTCRGQGFWPVLYANIACWFKCFPAAFYYLFIFDKSNACLRHKVLCYFNTAVCFGYFLETLCYGMFPKDGTPMEGSEKSRDKEIWVLQC
jgi:hypothetical protein